MGTLSNNLRLLILPADGPEEDRSLGLAVFGAIEILMGIAAFSLAMILMEFIFMPHHPVRHYLVTGQMNWSGILPTNFFIQRMSQPFNSLIQQLLNNL